MRSCYLRRNPVKCKCGHTIEFYSRHKKIICNWCGELVYRTPKEEFKDKLEKRGIKYEQSNFNRKINTRS